MINHTDTEDDTTNTATCRQSKSELNLNIIADEIVHLQPKNRQDAKNPNTFQESSVTYHHDVILKPQYTNASTVEPAAENFNSGLPYEYIIPMCGSETNVNAENLDAFITVQNTLLTNQAKILEQLNSIENFHTTIIQKIASLSVQLDDALLQINNCFQNGDSQVTPLSASKSTPGIAFKIKPIENVQQLDELELELSNSSNRQQKMQLYSIICSGGKGINCAYTFAEILFTRDFLCQCSWSGGSRGNNEAKIAWKAYKNILSFFWEMVNSWDKTYTISQNVDFFKSILKNAKKRNMAKKERASTSRKRAKRTKCQSVNDETESDKEATSVNTAKKAKIEKKRVERNDNNADNARDGADKESAKNLDGMIEKNECSDEEKRQETGNDHESSRDVDSNIDENENTEEEEEDNEREEDSDQESTVESDKIFEINEGEHNKSGEQKEFNKNMNYPDSTLNQNETLVNEKEKRVKDNEEDTLKEKKEEKNSKDSNSINVKIAKKNDRKEEKTNSITEENEKKDIETDREKHHDAIKLDSNITNKENENIQKKKEEKKSKDSNSINVKIAKKNDRKEEKTNSIIEINEKKDNETDREKLHDAIKLDANITNKENENVKKRKEEKKGDRGTHYKSKKYMTNKKKKEAIMTQEEK